MALALEVEVARSLSLPIGVEHWDAEAEATQTTRGVEITAKDWLWPPCCVQHPQGVLWLCVSLAGSSW